MYSQLFQFEGNLANSGDAGFGNIEVVDSLPNFTVTPQGQGIQLGSILRLPELSLHHMAYAGSFGFKVRVNTGCTQGVLIACDYDDGADDQNPVWALTLTIGATPQLHFHGWRPLQANYTVYNFSLPSYDTWHEVVWVVANSSGNQNRPYIDGAPFGNAGTWYGGAGSWIGSRPAGNFITRFGLSEFGNSGPSYNIPVTTTCTGVDVDWLFSSDNFENARYTASSAAIPTGDRPLFVGATNAVVPPPPTVLTATQTTETTNTHLGTLAPALYGPPMSSGGGGPTESRREFWS